MKYIYPISNAAKLPGISAHTLRIYEKEDLIVPFKKEAASKNYIANHL
jgi:MerR family transcriptional regulator, heat shock protein HspR